MGLFRKALAAFAACGLLSVVQVRGMILGLDIGSEFFKVAKIQAGASPIEIVLNKESKRKSANAVSFFQPIRNFGDDAVAHAVKAPQSVVQKAFRNLGLGKESLLKFDEKYYPVSYEENDRGTVDVVLNQMRMPLETAVAHLLGHARAMVKEDDPTAPLPKECVITIPASFTQRQRQAVVNAAKIAGLKVKALVHDTVAAAVQRAVDYSPANATQIMMFNMGSQHTEVCIVSFHQKAAGMVAGRTAPVVDVLGCAEDTQLGGHHMDLKIADYMMTTFVEKYPKLSEAQNSLRVRRKLITQSIKTKAVLSANKEAGFSVESLFEDTDFQTSLTRVKFEELIGEILERVEPVVKKALLEANTTLEQIGGVEVVGGAWRVPKVQQILSDLLNKDAEEGKSKDLGQHLNGEESIALGAVLVGANASNTFRVKKIFFQEIHPHGFAIEVTRIGNDTDAMMLSKDDDASKGLLPKGGPMIKKKLTLKECPCYNDIKIDLFENQGDSQKLLTTYELQGVAEAINKRITNNTKYNLTNITKDMPKVVVWLQGDTNGTGIASISKAEVIIEGSYWYSVNETVTKNTTSAKTNASNSSSDNSTEEGEAKEDSEKASEGEAKEDSEKSSEGEAESEKASESTEDAEKAPEGEEGASEAKKAEGDESADGEKTADESANDTNATNASIGGFKAQVEYVTVWKKKTKKYTDTLKIVVTEHLPRPLNSTELEEQKKALKEAQEKDDLAKKLDAISNDLEAFIYGTRDKLDSELWQTVTTEEQREELSKKLSEVTDWREEEDPSRTVQDFEGKLYALNQLADPIQERAGEYEGREDLIEMVKDELSEADKSATFIKEKMPWVNETKVGKAKEDMDEFVDWWNKAQDKQKETANHEAPVYMKEEVKLKIKKISDEFKRLKDIPKPKDDTKKKEKEEKKEAKKKEKQEKKDAKKKGPAVDTTGYDIAKAEEELKKMTDEKAEAVTGEDYDKADKLKKEIDKVKKILEALQQMEKEKASAPKEDFSGVDLEGWDKDKVEAELKRIADDTSKAVEAEDFDKATALKEEKATMQQKLAALEAKEKEKEKASDASGADSTDVKTKLDDQAKKLGEELEAAIASEDFDKAKQLKEEKEEVMKKIEELNQKTEL